MDFTLSLAHFCEIHGPTSLICTQAVPASCSICSVGIGGLSRAPPLEPASPVDLSSGHGPESAHTTSSGSCIKTDGKKERCSSCSLSLPAPHDAGCTGAGQVFSRGTQTQTCLRTQESIHVCGATCSILEHERTERITCVHSANSSDEELSNFPCHAHRVEYISSCSPVKPGTFSAVRRATIRTLSGEQLPRGQPCGPLLYGDPKTGYTIAYGFRLADVHARGRQRYYALVALAGSEAGYAIAACTILWAFFEKIAAHILQSAGAVTARASSKEATLAAGQVIPVSSFLTGRALDSDGFPRCGAQIRANGIVDLVGNEDFFYELHLTFVTILQQLKDPESLCKSPINGRLSAGLHVDIHATCQGSPECCLRKSSFCLSQVSDKVGLDDLGARSETRLGPLSAFDQRSLGGLDCTHRFKEVLV